MSDIKVVHNGKVHDSWAIQAVDALLEKVRTKDMWEVIDFLVEIFHRKYPDYKKESSDLKNKFGATSDLSMRVIAKPPEELRDLLAYFYEGEINSDPIKFWRRFAKRYPQFAFAEKI